VCEMLWAVHAARPGKQCFDSVFRKSDEKLRVQAGPSARGTALANEAATNNYVAEISHFF
jgi:hypothetical protein